MFLRISWLVVLVLFVQLVMAQPPAGETLTPRNADAATALGVRDATQFDQLMVTVAGVGSSSRFIQEQQTLKPYMMPVRTIGFRGSDWSYALATCLEYYVNLSRNFKDNLSPDYISLSLQAGGQRPSLEQGLRFLAQDGTVSAAIVPYDAAQIPSTVYATAKYNINNFLHLFQPYASPREKTFEMRKALMRGNPVVIEVQAEADLPQLSQSLVWQPQRTNQARTFTLIVVGFDEKAQSFEVLSCWGNTWGNNGYCWVSYNDLANVATNGYVMIPGQY
ncbi:MAG: C1 family peptidase [Bacteroidota bacterium]